MKELLRSDRHYIIIVAGDFKVQFAAKAVEGWKNTMDEHAQFMWG